MYYKFLTLMNPPNRVNKNVLEEKFKVKKSVDINYKKATFSSTNYIHCGKWQPLCCRTVYYPAVQYKRFQRVYSNISSRKTKSPKQSILSPLATLKHKKIRKSFTAIWRVILFYVNVKTSTFCIWVNYTMPRNKGISAHSFEIKSFIREQKLKSVWLDF